MSNRKQRHLSPAGFLLALALLIVGIFAADYVYRLFFRSSTENIIGTGGFSTTSSSSGTASEDGENATDSTEETQPSGIVLQLTAADQASGPLVLADASHPYTGTSVWSDFSAVTDANVKTRSTSLQVQPEIIQPICELFDAYAAANGYANLQIYSTLDGTLDSTSIYTNILPRPQYRLRIRHRTHHQYGRSCPLYHQVQRVDGGKFLAVRLCAALSQRQDRYHRNCLCTAPFPVCGKNPRCDHAREQLHAGGISQLSPELSGRVGRSVLFGRHTVLQHLLRSR